MIEPTKHVWLDGALHVAADSRVELLTHSLHYGYAALDGFRSYRRDDGTISVFRLHDHLRRLRRSASFIGLDIPFEEDELVAGTLQLLAMDGLADAYVRPLVFVGAPNIVFAHWLNQVHVALMAFPWSGYSDRDQDAGTPATVARYRRNSAHGELYGAKLTGHYMLSVLAYGEARRAGMQQAVFLDEEGFVCECTGENIFAVRGGALVTPPSHRALLAGITRDSVLALATDLKLPATEQDLTVQDLLAADEVFSTGTASGILPLPALDGRPVGSGDHSVSRALRERYLGIARGRVADHPEWVTPVPFDG